MVFLIDCGERPDESETLWALADVLCCACGGHAGDEQSMARVVHACRKSGVRLGAHPSYPDRAGFGRTSPLGTPGFDVTALRASLASQCRSLRAIAEAAGVPVTVVKPHGALYHDAAVHAEIASVLIDVATDVFGSAVAIAGPPQGILRDQARRRGLEYWREGFADRRLREDGSLVPRDQPGAVITDAAEAARQAVRLARHVDVICVHGDTADAVAILRTVREAIATSEAQPPWQAMGDRAIRFRRPAGITAASLVEQVRSWPGVVDVVAAPEDVAVYFNGEPSISADAVAALSSAENGTTVGREVVLPAIYDGPDLADVALLAGLTEQDVVDLHASATYLVDAVGFAPGFAYLSGLDQRLHVPRRPTPRTRVPPGAIALAGGYTGVYPFESPGGWHLIGRVVGVQMFDSHGARLRLGDRVRFVR